MRIYDILHNREHPENSDGDNGGKNNHDLSSGHHQIQHPIPLNRKTNRKASEARLAEIRARVDSGYYNQREILEKVADALYRNVLK